MPSLRPSSFVEGGAVPVDMNLLWKQVRYNVFDYIRKDGSSAGQTIAAKVDYVADDGQEFEQQYSIGDPKRFTVAADGKTIEGPEITKSCNFALLINALVNAGFPENKLPEDGNISILDGLYTYNIGLPEPKRAGLERTVVAGETARVKVLSVPSKVLRLPWEKKGAKTAAKAGPAAGKPAGGAADVTQEALAFVAEEMVDGSVTRADLATAVFTKLIDNPNKDAIANLVFSPAFATTLIGAGYKVAGETISK